MADMNSPINDAPAEQAPAIAPLDEQWFNIHKENIKDALQITPTNDTDPFMAPPSSDRVIEYVNTLGYPCTLKNVSAMSINSLYQPQRAILPKINMYLTDKTARFDRRRHPVLHIIWGVIHRSNIDYAERIWEEFFQSIQTFLIDKKNLTTAGRGKKKSTRLLIPSIRFTKLTIHYLKTKHNFHPRTNSPLYYSHDDFALGILRAVRKDEHSKEKEGGVPECPRATKKHTAMPTEPSGHAESPSLDEEVALTDSESKSNKGGADASTQQNPKQMDEEFTSTAYPNVQENLKLPSKDQVILEDPTSSTRTLSSLQNLDKELSFTNQFLMEKPHEEEQEKTNIEFEVHLRNCSHSTPHINSNNLSSHDNNNSSTTTTSTTAKHRRSEPIKHIEILQQQMFEDKSYEAHEDHKNLFDALEKSLECGYSNQLLTDLKATRQKKRKRRDLPRTPSGKASSSSKTTALTLQSISWTTSDTRYESTGVSAAQESSPIDFMINDDSIPDEQVQLSDDEDIKNDQFPKADTRKYWWKPLPKKERPTTPELLGPFRLPICQILRTTGLLHCLQPMQTDPSLSTPF
nr:hypothetical protein [Tanacetum cinerariifolium]